MYRQILRHAAHLPGRQSIDALKEARNTFRENKSVTDVDKAFELLKVAESKLAYLQMSVPRHVLKGFVGELPADYSRKWLSPLSLSSLFPSPLSFPFHTPFKYSYEMLFPYVRF